jgi:glyoxylase-like metal-dependent hydrolase (beta-lactamase superfamily II)
MVIVTASGPAGPVDVGGYRIDPVVDGDGAMDPLSSFPETTPEDWHVHRAFQDEAGQLPWALGGFLLRGHGRVVLVDLGYGPGVVGGIRTGRFLTSLSAAGVDRADVTDVLFTHLHIDHVGWASIGGVPQFPNATLRCAAADYDHFVADRQDPPSYQRLDPCQHQLAAFDDSAPLPGITVVPAPGHTPGSTLIVVSDPGKRAVLLGDVVHCPVQLLEPEWNTIWDVDPALARRTRERVVRELEGDPSLTMTAGHFPELQFGRLFVTECRRQWTAPTTPGQRPRPL